MMDGRTKFGDDRIGTVFLWKQESKSGRVGKGEGLRVEKGEGLRVGKRRRVKGGE